MKRFIFVSILSVFFILLGLRFYSYFTLKKNDSFEVFLAYNPYLTECSYVLSAYESVLQEEGIPFEKTDNSLLTSINIDRTFTKKHPVIILPDCAMQQMNPEVVSWFKNYLNDGGNILLVYDVGVKNYKGAYLKNPLFTSILGINYCPYDKSRDRTYTVGAVEIRDPVLLSITPGKLGREQKLIKGYSYGTLDYPVVNVDVLDSSFSTLAEVVLDDNKKLPGIVLKDYGKGKLLYVNLPIGYLKAYSDDFILRSILRTFLFKILHIPHLANVPYGVGGLVINWHIDANPEWKNIPYMIENGYFLKDIQFSNHITSGDFRDKPGDKFGFDACGKGKEYVRMLLPYGEIGSHGGWAHNWFSYGILDGRIGREDIEKYIKMNNECLESITGYKIREYSAPNGVHPQPETTKILEKLGVVAYYYTGDSGSSPNRTFFNGKMVSSKVLAFPITPFEKFASFYEIWKGGVSETEVEKFLLDLLNYTAREKVIRLFYSHPYDIPRYPQAIKRFIETASVMQKEGKIQIKPMSYFADFLLRFLNTRYSFNMEKDTLQVNLENQEGLEGITIAIPKNYKLLKASSDYSIYQDREYNYLTVLKDVKKINFSFKF